MSDLKKITLEELEPKKVTTPTIIRPDSRETQSSTLNLRADRRKIFLLIKAADGLINMYVMKKIMTTESFRYAFTNTSVEGISFPNFIAFDYEQALIELEKIVKQDPDSRKVVVQKTEFLRDSIAAIREINRILTDWTETDNKLFPEVYGGLN